MRQLSVNLATKYRYATVAWWVSKGAMLAWFLHPVVHMVLRLLGLQCP